MTRKRGEVWGYSCSEHAEFWTGACETREEAIDEASSEYEDDVEIWVVRGEWIDPAQFFDCDKALDDARELLLENAPEEAEFEIEKGAVAELDALVKDWCARNVDVDKWTMTGKPELVTKEERRRVATSYPRLTLDAVKELLFVANQAIPSSDYEPHPERDVEFRKQATPSAVLALCDEVIACRGVTERTPSGVPGDDLAYRFLEVSDHLDTTRRLLKVLEAREHEALALLERAREALSWCSGSGDFAPEGKAHVGWERLCRPLIATLDEKLKWMRTESASAR